MEDLPMDREEFLERLTEELPEQEVRSDEAPEQPAITEKGSDILREREKEWKAIKEQFDLDESVEMIGSYCNGLAGRLGLLISNAKSRTEKDSKNLLLKVRKNELEAQIKPDPGSELHELNDGKAISVDSNELAGYIAKRTRACADRVRAFLLAIAPELASFPNCLPGLKIDEIEESAVFAISMREYEEPDVQEVGV